MAVDYFTNWIAVEALVKIIATNILKFFKRNILARDIIMQVVITENSTQFTDRNFKDLLEDLKVKKLFTSVEHPHTNGKPEVVSRVIVRGLKRRLIIAKGN